MKIKLICLVVAAVFCNSCQRLAEANQGICICKFAAPLYSPLARTTAVQGIVRLKVQVALDGSPGLIDVLEGNPLLSEQSVRAVKKWRFCPPQGTRTENEVVVTLKFILEGNSTDSYAPTEVYFETPTTVEIRTSPPGSLQY